MIDPTGIFKLRAIGAGLAVILSASAACAEMLDEPACNRLRNEEEILTKEGIKDDMMRGVEWGKENLKPERLKKIETLLEVQESLVFRCPPPPIPPPLKKTVTAKWMDVPVRNPRRSGASPATSSPVNDAYVPPAPPPGQGYVDGEAEPVPLPPSDGGSSRQLSP